MPKKKREIVLPTGRPPIDIDWKLVDEYIRAHMTAESIADLIGMHAHTFLDRVIREKGVSFTSYSHSKREGGKGNLLYKQYTSAMAGNTRMMELLGKEWLGQGKIDATGDVNLVTLREKVEGGEISQT